MADSAAALANNSPRATMPHVLLSPRKELMRNAAAAAANVLTDDDLLTTAPVI